MATARGKWSLDHAVAAAVEAALGKWSLDHAEVAAVVAAHRRRRTRSGIGFLISVSSLAWFRRMSKARAQTDLGVS